MINTKFCLGKPMALFCLLILVLISLSGCKNAATQSTMASKDGAFPVTVTDDLGRKVTIKAEPQRIISLAPSNTEVLFFLGLGDRVVGVTTYCDYPEAAKVIPKIGGFKDPSLEKVVALKPDLVFATGMHAQLIKQLEDAGLTVLVIKPNTIDGIFNSFKTIAKAAGVENKTAPLTKDLQDRVDAVNKKIASIPDNQRPAVYYEMWYEPLMSVGKNTLISETIKLAGGKSITADLAEQYPQISEEIIIEKNPDVLINSYGHDAKKVTPEEIAARKGWNELSFVKNNRIYTIESDCLTIAGPRIVDGLEKMAQCLYPDLFK